MDDELLVIRCQLGERDAFAELVHAWHVPVWTFVRRMLDAERADDVAQEVWVAVLRGLPRLAGPDRFAPWLFTIARRAVLNRLRHEYKVTETPAGPADTPVEDLADEVADRTDLIAALASLPAPEREILILFYLEDLSLDDCAQICEIPSGTAKSRLHRARRLLREHLTEKGDKR
jgi:RNA polymerase sigma-70 factor (ECF subfamily)